MCKKEREIMIKDIHFINNTELSKKLSNMEISDYLALKHFIIFIILFSSAYVFPILTAPSESNETVSWIINFISLAVINYYGITWTFQINNKGDKKEFFKRFSCLSLPISIKATIIFTLLYIISIILLSKALGDNDNKPLVTDILMYLLEIGYLIYFYKIMGQSIRISSNNQ